MLPDRKVLIPPEDRSHAGPAAPSAFHRRQAPQLVEEVEDQRHVRRAGRRLDHRRHHYALAVWMQIQAGPVTRTYLDRRLAPNARLLSLKRIADGRVRYCPHPPISPQVTQ